MNGGASLVLGLQIELDIEVLVLLPELEDFLRDVQANRFQLGFGRLVALFARQFLQCRSRKFQKPLRGLVPRPSIDWPQRAAATSAGFCCLRATCSGGMKEFR